MPAPSHSSPLTMRLGFPAAIALLSALAGTACASRHERDEDSDEGGGADVASVESDTEALGSSFVAEGSGSLGLAGVNPTSGLDFQGGSGLELKGTGLQGQALGDGATTFYQPAGCLTVTHDDVAKTIAYAFNGCSGKLGLLEITGTVVADYAQSTATELRVLFTADKLKINRAVIDWSASANITANGDSRNMVWSGKVHGVTGSGRALERTNTKTISWTKGTQCITVNGQSQGNLSGRELTTVVENFKRCEGECPEAGGKITVSGPNGSLAIVVLEGGRARVTVGARSAEFRLPCSLL